MSTFATRGFDVALVWLAVTGVGSAKGVGLVLFFKFLPYAVFGLIGGWLGDLFRRDVIIAVSDLSRGVLLLMMAGLTVRSSDVWTLSTISFLFTTIRTGSQPASQGLLPDLVEHPQLGQANSFLHGITEFAQTVSPIIMAILLKVAQPRASLFLLASVFVCAAFFVPKVEAHVVTDPFRPVLSIGAMLTSYRQTLARLRSSRPEVLAAMVVIPVAILGAGGMLNFSLPELLIREEYNHANYYGVVLAAMSFGTLPGAYICACITFKKQIVIVYVGWLVYGILVYIVSVQTGIVGFIVSGTLAGAVGAIADISLATSLQQGATKFEVSKTFAIFSTLANGSEALSAPIMSLIAAYWSIHCSFLLGSLIIIASSVCGLILSSKWK